MVVVVVVAKDWVVGPSKAKEDALEATTEGALGGTNIQTSCKDNL